MRMNLVEKLKKKENWKTKRLSEKVLKKCKIIN